LSDWWRFRLPAADVDTIGFPFPSSTLRIRNCGPPNSILAVNLASRLLDAAAP
jgi:hypothetical protein